MKPSLNLIALLTLSIFTPALAADPPVVIQNFDSQEIRALPGALDKTYVFNSNSPEVVLHEGILLSTFPPDGKASPAAHLNFPLSGRFDIFTHHIANAINGPNLNTLYQGILINNPGKKKVTVTILKSSSYLSQPDAPFVPLPDLLENNEGKIYAGPGDRITDDFIQTGNDANETIELAPSATKLLVNWPIPVKTLTPPLNGRSSLMRLKTTGPVYVADLAAFAKTDSAGQDISPTLEEWQNILDKGNLVTPREKQATPLSVRPIIYGRVSGIAQGTIWTSHLADKSGYLVIPHPGNNISYVISTIDGGTWGTKQIQSAPMIVRYPDTAFQAHGNYAIEYDLTIPLHNPRESAHSVSILFQTPVKSDLAQIGYFDTPPERIFFRGSLHIEYVDDNGKQQSKFVHLVERRGQKSQPLLTLNIKPHSTRNVHIEFLYPPDSTPPQVLTINTLPVETANH